MWVFFNDAFVSIVAHTEHPDRLHVRGRVRGDIERVFPGHAVLETPEGDYRYRADLPREEVGRVLAARAEAVDYPNFKGSVASGEHARHDAYMGVWSKMLGLQRAEG